MHMPKTEFIWNHKLRKGDVIYECFRDHTLKVRILSDPIRTKVQLEDGEYDAWDWDAELLEIHDYLWDGEEWCRKRVHRHVTNIHYRISDVPFQGAPHLFLEDIYQYRIGEPLEIAHCIVPPLGNETKYQVQPLV